MEKITLISQVLNQYFAANSSVAIVPAKNLMPNFINAGVFEKDEKKGLPIRKLLRGLDSTNQLHLIPFVIAERKLKNTHWFFARNGDGNCSTWVKTTTQQSAVNSTTKTNKKANDEIYVLDLCDEVLGEKGMRQHHFEFLRGDAGTKLPVDIFYPSISLVVEYRETQHTNAVKHFDKPDVMTVSGVHRGEQREIYDQRRRDVLPQNGIRLIEISYFDFQYDKRNRIVRNKEKDINIVKGILNHYAGN